ncbi:MAG TPA: hypothetical protein VN847_21325, partial [Streptosporangiaceae bacterium]|nr:hypothetical protein [Streptosporangiaceae bacterium]
AAEPSSGPTERPEPADAATQETAVQSPSSPPSASDPSRPGGPVIPAEEAAAMSGRDDPAPYVAPEDPNTGARTEPFRGPFEPPPGQPKVSEFVPSSSTLDDLDNLDAQDGEPARTAAPGPAAADTQPRPTLAAAQPGDGAALAVPPGSADPQDRGPASEEKLEKIKDLYLTVEAIGDDNVGKHFDELMTRQRELISDYFKETGIGKGPRAPQTDQPS